MILAAQHALQDRRMQARVVYMPSWELFGGQSQDRRDQELSPSVHARLAVEAGVSQGWQRYVGERGDVLSLERFGASASSDIVVHEYGFSAEIVCKRALALLH